jgi:hypothetical protein
MAKKKKGQSKLDKFYGKKIAVKSTDKQAKEFQATVKSGKVNWKDWNKI